MLILAWFGNCGAGNLFSLSTVVIYTLLCLFCPVRCALHLARDYAPQNCPLLFLLSQLWFGFVITESTQKTNKLHFVAEKWVESEWKGLAFRHNADNELGFEQNNNSTSSIVINLQNRQSGKNIGFQAKWWLHWLGWGKTVTELKARTEWEQQGFQAQCDQISWGFKENGDWIKWTQNGNYEVYTN